MSEDAARMEALYSKLFDQYKKLKTKRLGDLETRHKDQELKFGTYIDAVEELIEHLRTQNERLNSQVKDLRYELALRTTAEEQCAQYGELLAEEKRKNEELSREVESLRKVQLNNSKTSNGQPCTPASGQVARKTGSRYSERLRTNKRRKHSESETEDILVPSSSYLDDEVQRHSEKHSQKESMSGGPLVNVQQTESCRTFEGPGGCVNPIGVASSVCKVIAEYVLGLKISTNNETEENCVSAVHESSGYSFTLTWVQLAGMEDIFRYRVLSLGTLEKVAPDWMKDEAVFSGTMCRVFFERISYLVKQQS